MPVFDSILKTIGRTPVVRINKLAPPNVSMFVKVEAFNPMSSVKDRLAIGIIEDAERTGALKVRSRALPCQRLCKSTRSQS